MWIKILKSETPSYTHANDNQPAIRIKQLKKNPLYSNRHLFYYCSILLHNGQSQRSVFLHMFDLLMLPVNVCLRVTLSMNLLWMHYSNRWLYWDWFWSEQIGVTAVSLYRHALCIFPRLTLTFFHWNLGIKDLLGILAVILLISECFIYPRNTPFFFHWNLGINDCDIFLFL